MYSVLGYAAMVADETRARSYVQAMRQAITPGCVVLDIGTGTGVFALLACELGAGKVFAVEPSDAIAVGRAMAADAGHADRIEFIQALSTAVDLPTAADVIVSDLRGVLPFMGQHIPSIVDARRRHLAPSGVLIPRRDTLWAAVAEAPESYAKHAGPPSVAGLPLNMRAARTIGTNSWSRAHLRRAQLLAEPACCATLDYATVESPDLRATMHWTATRSGTAHGLVLWFDAELHDGVGFTNAPGGTELIYGSGFFPLSEPVPVSEGDGISATLQARLIGDDYVWRWDTTVTPRGAPEQARARFRQSTFLGTPLSAEHLRRQAHSHVPVLNEEGQIDHFILSLMDGKTSLGDIARRVTDKFPSRYTRWEDALTRVGIASLKYSRAT